jgi:hypothetical protein
MPEVNRLQDPLNLIASKQLKALTGEPPEPFALPLLQLAMAALDLEGLGLSKSDREVLEESVGHLLVRSREGPQQRAATMRLLFLEDDGRPPPELAPPRLEALAPRDAALAVLWRCRDQLMQELDYWPPSHQPLSPPML